MTFLQFTDVDISIFADSQEEIISLQFRHVRNLGLVQIHGGIDTIALLDSRGRSLRLWFRLFLYRRYVMTVTMWIRGTENNKRAVITILAVTLCKENARDLLLVSCRLHCEQVRLSNKQTMMVKWITKPV